MHLKAEMAMDFVTLDGFKDEKHRRKVLLANDSTMQEL